MPNKFVIRCRAIIFYHGKLLVVKHSAESSFYAFPGGHLELGEDVRTCMSRELEEELGVKGEIGRLLYVSNFIDKDIHSVEFFFEIKNTEDYLKMDKANGSHGNEIAELRWIQKTDPVNLLPKKIHEDFKEGNLISDIPRFISS